MPEKKPAPAVPRMPAPKTLEEYLAGDDLAALVARYLEQHGRWETHTARVGTPGGGARTVEARRLVGCACPLCADARAHLKLED